MFSTAWRIRNRGKEDAKFDVAGAPDTCLFGLCPRIFVRKLVNLVPYGAGAASVSAKAMKLGTSHRHHAGRPSPATKRQQQGKWNTSTGK
jgi:hypothetical protein